MTVEAGSNPLRWIRAENPGPFTLDGTRTYIVGHRQVVVIDPGPDMDAHVRAVALAVADADEVTVLLSHGHGDHSDGVSSLMALLPEARLVGHGHPGCDPLPVDPDDPFAAVLGAETDAGSVFAIPTPGHTRDHLCFHWPAGRSLFAADMVLGEGDTTWVAEYPSCVADYLASLDRLETLELSTVYSAHGPVIEDVPGVWQRYRDHRRSRIDSTRAALSTRSLSAGEASRPEHIDDLLAAIYGGTMPAGLGSAARDSLRAVLHYLAGPGGDGPHHG